jgi:hypothetical protein
MSQNGGEYAYWDNTSTEPVYPMPQMSSPASKEELLDTLRSLQRTMQQETRPSLPPSSPAIALPGSGLTVTVETDTAKLRITFESKTP